MEYSIIFLNKKHYFCLVGIKVGLGKGFNAQIYFMWLLMSKSIDMKLKLMNLNSQENKGI